MKTMYFIIFLFFFSYSNYSHGNECVGNHDYKDIKLYVMKKKPLEFVFGYGSSSFPEKNNIEWSLEYVKGDDTYGYAFKAETVKIIINQLKPKNATIFPKKKFNAMFVTYKSENEKCVMSLDMDLIKMNRNLGEDVDKNYIVYINGKPYLSEINPYVPFYDGLSVAEFMDLGYN